MTINLKRFTIYATLLAVFLMALLLATEKAEAQQYGNDGKEYTYTGNGYYQVCGWDSYGYRECRSRRIACERIRNIGIFPPADCLGRLTQRYNQPRYQNRRNSDEGKELLGIIGGAILYCAITNSCR